LLVLFSEAQSCNDIKGKSTQHVSCNQVFREQGNAVCHTKCLHSERVLTTKTGLRKSRGYTFLWCKFQEALLYSRHASRSKPVD